MIHDVDETIRRIIYDGGNITKSDVDVAFETPSAEWSATLNRPTINCWLFDIRENRELRQRDWTVQRENGTGRREQLPMRMNLTYLITAWANKVADEHQLIWRALAAFSQITILKPEDTEGLLQDQPYNMPTEVAQSPESSATFSDIWNAVDNDMRVGFLFTITVALDTKLVIEAPLVLEKKIVVGQSEEPPSEEIDHIDVELWQRADETD